MATSKDTNTGWWLRFYVESDSNHPVAAYDTHHELQEFLNHSRIKQDEYDKARFLEVGDKFHLDGAKYEVVAMRLKMVDFQPAIDVDASSLDVIVIVREVK